MLQEAAKNIGGKGRLRRHPVAIYDRRQRLNGEVTFTRLVSASVEAEFCPTHKQIGSVMQQPSSLQRTDKLDTRGII